MFHTSRKATNNFREKEKPILNSKKLSMNEHESVRRNNILITGWIIYFNNTNVRGIYDWLQKSIDWLLYKFIAYRQKNKKISSQTFSIRERTLIN